MILRILKQNIHTTLNRILVSDLQRYDYLQTTLAITDVSTDLTFQRTFNGYYRMRSRPADWYTNFYKLLESRKRDTDIQFQEVLRTIHRETGRVEPSFSSKLVATIYPESPVYDRYVRENLGIAIPRQTDPAPVRLRGFIQAYAQLCKQVIALVNASDFLVIKGHFDRVFPRYTHFSEVKKLDLLLWKLR